jgi:hypothetical protein
MSLQASIPVVRFCSSADKRLQAELLLAAGSSDRRRNEGQGGRWDIFHLKNSCQMEGEFVRG